MKNKSVLETIGVSNKIVKKWEEKGLKISYPMTPNKKYFKSRDGDVFVYGADQYLQPFTKKEADKYRRNPNLFQRDFLTNARFFISFCDFIYSTERKVEKLKGNERLEALLVLLYLFHSAMDHHYFHYDRYLAYEEYPETPVGYWWKKLEDIYSKAFNKRTSFRSPSVEFLKLIGRDKDVFAKCKEKLSKKEYSDLEHVLAMIKIFENTQQEEIKIVINDKNNENKFIKTVLPIWSKLPGEIDNLKIKKIFDNHPLLGTRILFSPKGLPYIHKNIISSFEKEIARWIN